jgi:Zn-dependent membrane protease YugP
MDSLWLWTIILLVPALVLGIYAQAKVSSSFNRYSQVPSARGSPAPRQPVWCSILRG